MLRKMDSSIGIDENPTIQQQLDGNITKFDLDKDNINQVSGDIEKGLES